MKFRLVNYVKKEGRPRSGLIIEDETVLDVRAAFGEEGKAADDLDSTSVLALLENWDTAYPRLKKVANEYREHAEAVIGPVSQLRIAAPILYPPNIYCAAANYADHSREMSDRKLPDKGSTRPYFFMKASRQTVIGTDVAIRIPYPDAKVDWEAEIGVIIGRTCRSVTAVEALGYVAGYTVFHDVSDRARNFREDWAFKFDWFAGKSFDTSAPMGPWITPAEFVPDPHNLGIRLWVNDVLMQDSSSRFMHFTIPEQIEYLSGQLTLLPGDVIATGTPAGVGHPKGMYLKAGDIVKITIEELGTIRNPVIAGY